MSTRAIYTFKSHGETHHVFVHHDGYITGAAEKIRKTIESGLAWDLPRFEADEFAAAFVAANKTGSGSVRLATKRTQYRDVAFGYTITQNKNALQVVVHDTDFWDGTPRQTRLWSGPLADFIARAEEIEADLN